MVKNLDKDERERIDAQLDWPLDEDRWGASPDAESGQAAMMRLMQGGN